MDTQEIVLGIIVNGGKARSNSMKAIKLAKKGEIDEARELLKIACMYLGKAHDIQTELIQNEAAGNKTEITLLMIHAQDHLMNAMTIKELASELVDIHEKMVVLK